MFHRTIWKGHNGDIPEGYEVHHKCNNRACFNPEHLEVIEVSKHKALTNSVRFLHNQRDARLFWERTNCTGVSLSTRFNIPITTACRWIRHWKRK